MIPLEKYLCFRCLHCGRYTGQQITKYKYNLTELKKSQIINKLNLKCKYCRKIITFRDKRQGGTKIIHSWFNNPSVMSGYIMKKNGERKS